MLALAVPRASLAQGVMVGFEAGVNFTEVEGFSWSTDGRTALVGGAFLGISLSRVWVLQPEFLYSQKGTSSEYYDLDLAFLEVPILIKARIPIGDGNVRPVLYAGPMFATRISCSESWSIDSLAGVSDECGNELSTGDFGIALGGGIESALGRGILEFSIRYTRSITPGTSIADDFENFRAWELPLEHRALSLRIGYGVHF